MLCRIGRLYRIISPVQLCIPVIMLIAWAVYSIDSSPGPQYFVDAKITRFGRDGTPAYSMLGRMRKTGEPTDSHYEQFHLIHSV